VRDEALKKENRVADLDRTLKLLEDTRSRLLAEVEPMALDDFGRRPAPEAWSAAHVLDHLAVLEGRLVPHFRAMVAGTKPSTVSLFDRLRCLPPRIVLWRGIRIRNPKIVAPAEQPPGREELVARLRTSRADLVSFIEENRDRDLTRYRLVHKALGGIHLYAWFEMIACHEERHRQQIAEIRESLAARR
jgi:hypothetical protein